MSTLTREQSLEIANKGVGFHQAPYQGLHTKGTLENLPLGYDLPGDDVHHIFGVQDHMRMFIDNLDEREQENMLRRMNQKGIRFGNDPINLISLKKGPHIEVHRMLRDRGIDAGNRKDYTKILRNVGVLPYHERIHALDVYADHFYPAIIEEMHALGHMVPTQAENIELYKREIAEEAALERMEHIKDMKAMIEAEPVINPKTGKPVRNNEQKTVEYIKRLDNIPSYYESTAGPVALAKARSRKGGRSLGKGGLRLVSQY